MAFSDPQHNLKQLGLHEGDIVVDLGAGTGAYTVAAARDVGGSGRVYAVEVQKDFLQKIKDVANDAGFSNVETLWGDIERVGKTKIGDRIADAAIIANVLFQIEDTGGTLEEVNRILKPGGRVLVVDWKDSYGGMGPQAGDILVYDDAKRMFAEAGFTFLKNIDAGDHHYGFIVKKNG